GEAPAGVENLQSPVEPLARQGQAEVQLREVLRRVAQHPAAPIPRALIGVVEPQETRSVPVPLDPYLDTVGIDRLQVREETARRIDADQIVDAVPEEGCRNPKGSREILLQDDLGAADRLRRERGVRSHAVEELVNAGRAERL